MEKFEAAYRGLNLAQRQAVDTIDGPVLVIAGPGTGKTQLLSLRAANILRRTDASPGNILCLTYTESAQQAMRERLVSLVGPSARKFEIHTFHGFGVYLIGRFPEYFPQLTDYRPADDLALFEALLACLEKLPRGNPLSKQSYGQFVYQQDAASRISQLKQAGITPEEAAQKAKADAQWCAKAGRKISAAFFAVGRLSPKAVAALQSKLQSVLTDKQGDGRLAQSFLRELTGALQSAEETGKTTSLSELKKKWLASENGELYFKPTDQIKKLLALAELYGQYEAELRRRKLYDYDDMILCALKALETNKEFRARVQETYQYILADEYQDTNVAQAKIITLIADNPVNEGRPNVMVVGDDDQAIYGFQGALGDVLLHFRETWRDVTTITLKDNYRSTQTIVDSARSVILNSSSRLENYYDDIDKSLMAHAEYQNIEPLMVVASSPSAVLHRAMAAAKSASRHDQLAIIATKHKYLRELADLLDAANVDYYYEGREDLLKDPSVIHLLMLASVCLAIKQKNFNHTSLVLPKLLAAGVIKLKKAQAWTVAIHAKQKKVSWWEALVAMRQTDATDALNVSAQAINQARALGSLQAIARQYNLRVLRKTKALVNHGETYYGHSNLGLSDLLRYAELCQRAGVTLDEKVVKGRADAGVVLLSAHKSKGLEFDQVLLLHADHYTWLKERGRRNNLVLPEGWNHIEPSTATLDDKLRLLYVVMTRAKKGLNLVRSDVGHGNRPAESLPGLENIRTTNYISEQMEAFALPPEDSWQSWYLPKSAPEQTALKKLLKPILDSYRLSPSHLTTFLDIPHGGPAVFLVNRLFGIPEPPHPEVLFGNGVHRALHYAQKYLNKNGSLPSVNQLKAFVKANNDLSSEQINDIIHTVNAFIKHTHILQNGGVGEYNFSKENITFQGVCLTGTADHYLKQSERLIVTDYKTGRALNSWQVREDYYKQKLHRFRQQLLFYELLFKLNPEFADVSQTELKIAFVEPSRRNNYYELILDADEKERAVLQNLIQVVWQKITQADFPGTAAYGADYNGVVAFEEDLIKGNI